MFCFGALNDRLDTMKKRAMIFRFTVVHLWILSIVNLVLIAVVLCLLAPKTNPVDVVVSTPTETATKEDTEADIDEDALNVYGKSALRAGLKNCALPMNQLAERVLVGHKVGAYRFPAKSKGFASMSMEVATKSGGVAYMTFNLSEPVAGQCVIAYEAVSQWNNKCEDVVKKILTEFIPTRMLGERIAILTHKDNENRKVFTMPVGEGCIATEKEIISFVE